MSFDSLLHSLIKIPEIHSGEIGSDNPGAFSRCMTEPWWSLARCQLVHPVPKVTVRDFRDAWSSTGSDHKPLEKSSVCTYSFIYVAWSWPRGICIWARDYPGLEALVLPLSSALLPKGQGGNKTVYCGGRIHQLLMGLCCGKCLYAASNCLNGKSVLKKRFRFLLIDVFFIF